MKILDPSVVQLETKDDRGQVNQEDRFVWLMDEQRGTIDCSFQRFYWDTRMCELGILSPNGCCLVVRLSG